MMLVFLQCVLGWEEGSGLGAQKQGIEEPIRGGEVRDNVDKYKVNFMLAFIKMKEKKFLFPYDISFLCLEFFFFFFFFFFF